LDNIHSPQPSYLPLTIFEQPELHLKPMPPKPKNYDIWFHQLTITAPIPAVTPMAKLYQKASTIFCCNLVGYCKAGQKWFPCSEMEHLPINCEKIDFIGASHCLGS